MLRPRASGFCQITDLIHLIIFMHQSQILDSILQPFIFFCFLCSLVLFFFARTCIYSTFCSKALLSDHFGECFLAFSLPWNILIYMCCMIPQKSEIFLVTVIFGAG